MSKFQPNSNNTSNNYIKVKESSNISIEIDTEENSQSATNFNTQVSIPNIKKLGLQAYRVQGMPTIVTGINDTLYIISPGGTSYKVVIPAGRYAADVSTNTVSDNIVAVLNGLSVTALSGTGVTVSWSYLTAANKIIVYCSTTGWSIAAGALTPRIANTLGLYNTSIGNSTYLQKISLGTSSNTTLLPFCPTLLLTRYIDIHSDALLKFNPTDGTSSNQTSSLLYRIFLYPPKLSGENDVQIEQIMHVKYVSFDETTTGPYLIDIKIDGEAGLTFPFDTNDTNAVGKQLDICLQLIAKTSIN